MATSIDPAHRDVLMAVAKRDFDIRRKPSYAHLSHLYRVAEALRRGDDAFVNQNRVSLSQCVRSDNHALVVDRHGVFVSLTTQDQSQFLHVGQFWSAENIHPSTPAQRAVKLY